MGEESEGFGHGCEWCVREKRDEGVDCGDGWCRQGCIVLYQIVIVRDNIKIRPRGLVGRDVCEWKGRWRCGWWTG